MVEGPVGAELLARARDWLADDPDPATRHELAELLARIEAAGRGRRWPGHARPIRLADLADRFAADLEFGTAGLRGRARRRAQPHEPGRGDPRRRRPRRLAARDRRRDGARRGVAIGFDARLRSADFADDTAEVLAAAGIRAMLLPGPLPTPVLAFAVRHLGAAAGVMVTASHNPPRGQRLQGLRRRRPPRSCRRIDARDRRRHRRASSRRVGRAPPSGARRPPTSSGLERRRGRQAYVDGARGREPALHRRAGRVLRIVYTAMHGVGAPARRPGAAPRAGFGRPSRCAEQAEPDRRFPHGGLPQPRGARGARPGPRARRAASARDARPRQRPRRRPPRRGRARPARARRTGWRAHRQRDRRAARRPRAGARRRRGRRRWWSPRSCRRPCSRAMAARPRRRATRETLTGFKWISRAPGGARRRTLRLRLRGGPGLHAWDRWCATRTASPPRLLFAELAARCRPRAARSSTCSTAWPARTGSTPRAVVGPGGRHRRARPSIAAAMDAAAGGPARRLAGGRSPPRRLRPAATTARGWPPTRLLVLDLDGGRVVVRPSGTEPKLKIYVEVVEPVAAGEDVAAARARAATALDALTAAIAAATGL